MFNDTELGKTLEELYSDATSQHFRLPFKYRTIQYMAKILSCPEV